MYLPLWIKLRKIRSPPLKWAAEEEEGCGSVGGTSGGTCWQWWFVLMLVLVGILAMTVAVGPYMRQLVFSYVAIERGVCTCMNMASLIWAWLGPWLM